MRSLSLSLAVGALAFVPGWSTAHAESACAAKTNSKTVEKVGNGEIDYGRCVIRVFGNGAPPSKVGKGAGAIARARLMAERAAQMISPQYPLRSPRAYEFKVSTADELAFQNPMVRTKVQGAIRTGVWSTHVTQRCVGPG